MHLFGKLRTVLARSSRAFIWSATACGLLILLSFFAMVGYDAYRSALEINRQAATNIATLTQQDVARNIELYDLSLQGVLEGLEDPDLMSQEPRLRQKSLFDRSTTAHGLGALVVLDRNGSIVLDSRSAIPRVGNFSDREYFIAQRDAKQDLGLYVSEPFHARLQDYIWTISVSRRVNLPNGQFGGIVSGTIKLEYFQQVFNKVALGLGGTITLLKDNGVVIARNVFNDDKIGSNWSKAPFFTRLSDRTQGSFIGSQSENGSARLFAFQRVDQLPLVVVVELPIEQILAPWWSKVIVLTGIFAVMAASVIALVWMLEAELRRRAAAESAAAELARTDGLTSLANRRSFEERLSYEWLRCARDARPISLLMIDTDHFKLFNDTYGHQAGDRVLTAIAQAIAEEVRRPGDLAARYGGEEFVVLLPNTDLNGAKWIAGAIADSVNSMHIDHAASVHKIVTISIGIATLMPRSGMKAALLIRDADAALYRAKGRGRNTICVSNVVSAQFEAEMPRAG